MAAPKGNQFWKQRSKHGRDKLFKTPELLLEAAQQYFQWCDDNPWISRKSGTNPKGATSEEKPTQRPYTLSGLMVYVGANTDYWRQFKLQKHEDFSTVIKEIENIIETQQFEGAITGVFNANIIARKLGLVDKKEVKEVKESRAEIEKEINELIEKKLKKD